MKRLKRIALTGGPGGGKTTAAEFFRCELGDKVAIVSEAATIVYTGGFARTTNSDVIRSAQRAIYHFSRNLEEAQAAMYPDRILLCDRGTVDGAVYWPDGPEGFFREMGTSLEKELSRYDAVVFFESGAMGGYAIEGNNPARTESLVEAARLDAGHRGLWSQHPNFYLVSHQPSFLTKIGNAVYILKKILAR